MFLQVSCDPERLAASRAAEGLLSTVKSQVRFQVFPKAEAFAALRADVRPLPRVEPQVAAEALSECERLGAHGARVRLFTCVEALVTPEYLPPFECLLADVASVPVTSVGDDLPETPDTISARGEAAEAVASVNTLVLTHIFGQRQSYFAVSTVKLRFSL